MDNGEGLKGLIPPLANSDYWTTHRADLPCLVRKGIKGKMVVNGVEYGNQEMLGISRLTEFEITNIFNYINNSWGNQGTLWTGDEVRNALKNCE